jgi:hypothetical protein
MPGFAYRTFASSLTDRAHGVADAARSSWRRARKAVDDARAEVEDAAQKMGLPTKEPPIIDVGERPSALVRLLQGATGLVVLALLAGGALSLFTFFLQLVVAYVLATQVLGLRIDLPQPVA